MTFKIGKLIARNGELSWKSFRDEENRYNTTNEENPYSDNSRYSKT